MKSSRGLKIYPDQAEAHSNLTNGRLVSQKVQNFAIVPSTAGDFVLPAMSITWFNTMTNKIEQATLPSQTIAVVASANGDLAQQNTRGPNTLSPALQNQHGTNTQTHLADSADNVVNTSAVAAYDNRLIWLLLSLWLLTCLGWILHVLYLKKSVLPVKKLVTDKSTNAGSDYLTLLAACKKNNAEQALNLILPWLKQLLSNDNSGVVIHNIGQAQAMVQDQNFATALNDLQQHLYGKSAINGAPSWQGTALITAIQAVNANHNKSTENSQPLSLNP
jgi:hypothetical protein